MLPLKYGSVDFGGIENDIRKAIPVVVNDEEIFGLNPNLNNNFGLYLHIGMNNNASVKADILNWADAEFIFPVLEIDEIRFASVEEIALMKLDAISRGGRKKDFWDMSEIFETHTLKDLFDLYQQKYPYNRIQEVINGMTNFQVAEQVPDPICLKQKHWDLIKLEMQQAVDSCKSTLK